MTLETLIVGIIGVEFVCIAIGLVARVALARFGEIGPVEVRRGRDRAVAFTGGTRGFGVERFRGIGCNGS